jgi:hypothetical protein
MGSRYRNRLKVFLTVHASHSIRERWADAHQPASHSTEYPKPHGQQSHRDYLTTPVPTQDPGRCSGNLNPLPDQARIRPDLPPSSSLHPSSTPIAALAESTPDGMARGLHQGLFGGHQLPHPPRCGPVCEADTPAQTKQTSRRPLHSCNSQQADRKALRRLKFAGVERGRWDFKSAALTDSAMPPLVTARLLGDSARLRYAKDLADQADRMPMSPTGGTHPILRLTSAAGALAWRRPCRRRAMPATVRSPPRPTLPPGGWS